MTTLGNLVHETTTGTGTGALTIAAASGKQRISAMLTRAGLGFGDNGASNPTLFISHRTAPEWAVVKGYLSDANTLVIASTVQSSNADAAVSWSAGTKDVACDVPASEQVRTPPTKTVLLSGSGTYSTPANCKYLKVRMIGGGGGGGGNVGAGSAGGTTTFGTSFLTATGGGGGPSGSGVGGVGGVASGGDVNIQGASASGGTTVNPNSTGCSGASSQFGGGGGGGYGYSGGNGPGYPAKPNTGAGGGSAGASSDGILAGGGGAGGYLEKLITAPLSSYSYSVGAGGAGGAGTAGGAGGSGIIIIEEFY